MISERPSNGPHDFDARITVVADGPISETGFSRDSGNILYQDDKHQQLPIAMDQLPLKSCPGGGALWSCREALTNRTYLANLAENCEPDVRSRILDGRVIFSLLLNSNGGLCGPVEYFQRAAEYFRSKKGCVNIYAGKRAHSAAGHIFQAPGTRYALQNSSIMWHDAAWTDPSKEYSEDEQWKLDTYNIRRRKQLRKFFSGKPDAIQTLNNVSNDSKNPRCDMYVEGQYLETLKLLHALFKNTEEMRLHYESATSASMRNSEWQTNSVIRYFVFSRLQEFLQQRYGMDFSLSVENTKRVKFVPMKKQQLERCIAEEISDGMQDALNAEVYIAATPET